ncbi:MAG TPA: hypothetical protein VG755_25730 [Nannocystaceae bacterium]|nr:hypothetical protein [Nannocystaceae bacterium]
MSKAPDDGLRLLVYDRTCRGRGILPGLSHVWQAGGALFSWMGRFDGRIGVSSWPEALAWLATYQPERKIAEVQYWGHGKWGAPRIYGESLREDCLLRNHELCGGLDTLSTRMLSNDRGLWWFRTCESFGAAMGVSFARAFADRIGCRAAGHTYIIGHFQSGLHSVLPGQEPCWAPDEALLEGTPDSPKRAAWSRLRAPNTITALHSNLPAGY